jgi:hypothetical protein
MQGTNVRSFKVVITGEKGKPPEVSIEGSMNGEDVAIIIRKFISSYRQSKQQMLKQMEGKNA